MSVECRVKSEGNEYREREGEAKKSRRRKESERERERERDDGLEHGWRSEGCVMKREGSVCQGLNERNDDK